MYMLKTVTLSTYALHMEHVDDSIIVRYTSRQKYCERFMVNGDNFMKSKIGTMNCVSHNNIIARQKFHGL